MKTRADLIEFSNRTTVHQSHPSMLHTVLWVQLREFDNLGYFSDILGKQTDKSVLSQSPIVHRGLGS